MFKSHLHKTCLILLFSFIISACDSDGKALDPLLDKVDADQSNGSVDDGAGSSGNSDGSDTEEEPVASLDLAGSATLKERVSQPLEGNFEMPEGYELEWAATSGLIDDVYLSEQKDQILVKVGSVPAPGLANTGLTIIFRTEGIVVQQSIRVDFEDDKPDQKPAFELSSETGAELAKIVDRQIDLVVASEYYVDGLLVSDKPQAAHHMETAFVSLAVAGVQIEGLPTDQDWSVGEHQVYGNYVLKNAQGQIWLSNGNSFAQARQFEVKKQNLIYPSLLLWSNGDTAVFRLAYMHTNAYFVNSLVRAYQVTSEQKYLSLAQRTLDKMLTLLVDDVFTRQFLYESDALYTGMDQGIFLEAVLNYAEFSGDGFYYQKAKDIAAKFKHTTEGTWNHYTNSVIGGLIVEQLKVPNQSDFNALVDNFSALFISEIERLDGFIPYIMDINDPRYLTIDLPTYHTYDMMLIAKQATYIDHRLNSQSIMDLMFAGAHVNYNAYYANNVEALLYSYQASKYENEAFAQQQAKLLDIATTTIQSHVSILRAATAFLYLQERTDYPKLEYKFVN